MVYKEGDVLIQEETGVRFIVLMTNTFEMTLKSNDDRNEVWIMPREEPEGFRMATEEDRVEDMPLDFLDMKQDLGINEVRLSVFQFMFERTKKSQSLGGRTEEAVANANSVLTQLFNENNG